ncbi:hypothetical protein LLEC1_06760 [Akanthomyces lecanii]|uniref:Glycoside hydrolase family 3 N-terminal domain-containing protein n=1 Tax=Cordyceps confragosa TaxID=2714763 RepID=A0A179IMP4_CORDF|nr:hypothetical protein LLEC1_06760 [Akanthomyces lecanii]
MRFVETTISLGLLLATHAKQCHAASDLDILAGQHVIYSFPSSSTPPVQLVQLTKAGLVGGVILFGENVDSNTAAAMETLRKAYMASPAPALLKKTTLADAKFFISTDQEGGQVRRMKNDEPKLSARQVGASTDPAAAGKAAGAAIATGVELIMLSWAVYPALDRRPAGLSNKWVQDELRSRLGFAGVTITDAMEAGSLSGFGSAEETAHLAAEAGMDLLLASGGIVTQGDTIRKALVNGIQSGRLDRTQFDDATKRIAAMRSKLWA